MNTTDFRYLDAEGDIERPFTIGNLTLALSASEWVHEYLDELITCLQQNKDAVLFKVFGKYFGHIEEVQYISDKGAYVLVKRGLGDNVIRTDYVISADILNAADPKAYITEMCRIQQSAKAQRTMLIRSIEEVEAKTAELRQFEYLATKHGMALKALGII